MNSFYTSIAYMVIFLDWLVANSNWIFIGLTIYFLIVIILLCVVRYNK